MATMTAGNIKELARDMLGMAREAGARISVGGTTVSIQIDFTPGDRSAYVDAENTILDILRHARTTSSGSTWGTDSGSVGGHVGLQGGYCRLNKSGVDRRLIKSIATIQGGA